MHFFKTLEIYLCINVDHSRFLCYHCLKLINSNSKMIDLYFALLCHPFSKLSCLLDSCTAVTALNRDSDAQIPPNMEAERSQCSTVDLNWME